MAENDTIIRKSSMKINKVKIQNYKCFKELSFELNDGLNILVGDNEAGKSTILEAIYLALTTNLGGKSIKNALSQYLFNTECIDEFISSLKSPIHLEPPTIMIELYLEDKCIPAFMGNGNSEHCNATGIVFKIEFDEDYRADYSALLQLKGNDFSLPIEFYKVTWKSFARESITPFKQVLKAAFIDSSSAYYPNGSDIFISRIIKDELDAKEKMLITQAYRLLNDSFGAADVINEINTKLQRKTHITEKKIKLNIDLSSANAWEYALITYLDNIPFTQIGKGEQCIIKTNLALEHKKTQEANIILIEEPENHLSHAKLNELLKYINDGCDNKQIIITSHSSFVCNKLGLEHLILLNAGKIMHLSLLEKTTYQYFKKLAGYDTLRLLLCKKAVLVEGDSDELIFQKAYMTKNNGHLPIQDGIDVISVGLSFLRFLEIASKINKEVAVLTDNDGDYDNNVTQKYTDYSNQRNIRIFADDRNHLNTLEPQFAENYKENLEDLKSLIGIVQKKRFSNLESIIIHMKNDKPGWAISVFESKLEVIFPKYILNAVEWCNE